MRFYQISEPINGQRFFTTLDEAKAAAREAASSLAKRLRSSALPAATTRRRS
jgi:hypothetical protein